MVRSFRPSSFLLSYISVLTVFLVGVTAAASDPARITVVANVTLRAQPSPASPAVAQLPLGTEVTEAGPAGLDKTWVRVRLADAREGWLQSTLARPLDPTWRWPVFDRIIAERLGRTGDAFPANAELVAFIERVAPEYTDPDGRARVEFARVRALANALKSIPRNGGRRDPYSTWLAGRKSEAIYDEPGGSWMVNEATLWSLHTRHSGSTSADDIAWFAVTNGLPGECEGYLACYLAARNRLQGEYLRRHPLGRHTAQAVAAVNDTVDILGAPPRGPNGHTAYEFDKARDCKDVTSSIDALTAAVKGTRVDTREAAMNNLSGLRRICQ